jgi:hypothetical protein
MHQAVVTLTGVVAGCALILLFYTAVRTQWPSNYASSTNDYGMIINRTVVRYVGFALAPTYFISLIVGTTVARAGGNALVVVACVGLFQTCKTYAVHIYKTIRYDHSGTRYPTLLLEATLVVSVLLVAVLAGLGPGPFAFLVPPVDEFFKSLWTTAFIAILGVVVLSRTRVSVDIGRLIKKSRREVGSELLTYARQQATAHNTDPDLVEAVLLTENLQRPSWFRLLERIKGRFFPAGSYGVMQVYAPRPLGDRESITLAIAEHLFGAAVGTTKYGGFDYGDAKTLLARYNDNPNFVEVALQVLSQVWYENHPSQPPTRPVQAVVNKGSESAPSVDRARINLIAQVTQSIVTANLLLLTAPESELSQLKAHLDSFVASASNRSVSTEQSQ